MQSEKPARKNAQGVVANTLRNESLFTHPSVSDERGQEGLPIEFGRYRLLRMLGEGGMGAVYLAHDIKLDRQVALKLPHLAENKRDLSDRFRREARLAAMLDHPNICRVFDIGEHENRLFLTMELVEGKSLNDIIKAKVTIAPRAAAKLVSKLAAVVHFAHAKGILHRDLKPANIMIKKNYDFVIMDFGLAKRIEQEEDQLTATGAVLGTPAYMSPEQLRGDNAAIGAQSDVYSLGIILYELLAGQRPFHGTLPQIYGQILSADSVSPASIKVGMDAELDTICRKATAASVEQRYRTADELAKALASYSTGRMPPVRLQTIVTAPSRVSARPPRRAAWQRWAILAGGAFIPLLFGAIVIKIINHEGTMPEHKVPTRALSVEVINEDKIVAKANLLQAAASPAPTSDTPSHGVALSPPTAVSPFDEVTARAHQEAWAMHLGVPVEYTNSIGMKLRLIPPGEFLMGSTQEEIASVLPFALNQHWAEGIRSEAPQHKVVLTEPIYMGTVEVTQSDYEKVVGTNPSDFSSTGASKAAVLGIDTKRFPVEHVTGKDCIVFCVKLSQLEDFQPSYQPNQDFASPEIGNGYRLPTEAEWEFACRAGTQTPYWYGNSTDRSAEFVWCSPHAGGRPHEVGQLKPNPFGLYDMLGNVWERVEDLWEIDSYERDSNETNVNPRALVSYRNDSAASPKFNAWRVLRGGNFSHTTALMSRSSFRHHYYPTYGMGHCGFRVVLPVAAVLQMRNPASSPVRPSANSNQDAVPTEPG